MSLPDHYRVIAEVRAFAYEADQLRHKGTERALGMYATAKSLSSVCHADAQPDELLSSSVKESLLTLRKYMADTEQLRQNLAVEQGRRTRPYSLSPHEELVELADIAGANAYLAYARASGVRQDNARQRPGSCNSVFYIMQHELRKQGVETQHMWWFEAGNNHHFLRTTMPNGDMLDMDPTWQQHLPQSTDCSQHPHVLVAPAGRIAETLAIHGVPESRHCIWLDAKADSRPETDWWGWSPVLEEIFDSDPWIPALEEHQLREWGS